MILRATSAVREFLKPCTSPTKSGKGHNVANNLYVVATPWLSHQHLLRGVASAPPTPPAPHRGVAGCRASSLRKLTSPPLRLRGAASGGSTSSPTLRSGNWWQHLPKSPETCVGAKVCQAHLAFDEVRSTLKQTLAQMKSLTTFAATTRLHECVDIY